ncbi:YncE family protein [Ktedonobacter racemifer]|uniref:40-residue YVTN family beta-propeller repeat protein n=1 Tax=Ktedonobacter racemifer DSM 44963 TaxID=485913 RepID=D6TMM0_KTERA|nr:YncE family protein [Ktedonobacter racemifer]EFH87020.1 hypothetical protein Krac_8341 [Ktedonobacter racemifer DSM 44963]
MVHSRRRLLYPTLLLTLTLMGLLLMGSSPRLAYADGGAPNLAYVAGASQGLSIIDIATQKVTKNVALKGNPHTVLLSVDGADLFVTLPQSNQVAVLDTHDGHTLCTASVPGQPTLLAYDLNTKLIYSGGNGTSGVREIDPKNCQVIRTLATDGPVYGLAMAYVSDPQSDTVGNQLWISSEHDVIVYDLKQHKQLASIPVDGGPQYLSNPPGTTVYVTTRAGNIMTIDLVSHKVTKILSGGSYGPMDFDETTGEMYVPDRGTNQLLVLNPVHGGFSLPKEPNRVISLEEHPQSVAITSDGQFAFIALTSGKVVMYDVPGRQPINTLAVGGNPQFIITGLYPPALAQATNVSPDSLLTIVNIVAYVLIVCLLLGLLFIFLRSRKKAEPHKKG